MNDRDESESFESQLLTKTHQIGFLILLMMGCHHSRKKKNLIKNLHKILERVGVLTHC